MSWSLSEHNKSFKKSEREKPLQTQLIAVFDCDNQPKTYQSIRILRIDKILSPVGGVKYIELVFFLSVISLMHGRPCIEPYWDTAVRS